MNYNLTEKLKFDVDPVITVKDVELTVNTDAETVLQILDVLQTKGETAGAMEAIRLLFSEKDQKKLKGLHLKIGDFMEVIRVAVQLALGNDPYEEESGE